MAIIDPVGLFHGERLRKCSNSARLFWPYLFLASNGFGRLEIDCHRIVATAFGSFKPVPTEEELMGYVREYFEVHLLFLYRSTDGALWGQWDCCPQRLNKYKTAADRRSPAPPEPDFSDWQNSYANDLTKTVPVSFADISENFPAVLGQTSPKFTENLPSGVGVVDGEINSPRRTENVKTPRQPSAVALDLARLLQDEILKNNPQARISPRQVQNWALVADRMMRLDGRTEQDIENIIRWCQNDDFWYRNILSMEKLREKFDQLTLNRERDQRKAPDGEVEDDLDYKLGRPKWTGLADDAEEKEPRQ